MSFDDRDGVIWMNGKMVPWREANVHVLTHTLHYGMAVFEGIRAYRTDRGTAVFRLKEHITRLFESARILRMRIPYDPDTLIQACHAAVRENGLSEAYIRPICFLGSEGMGLRADNLSVHTVIAAWEWGKYLGAEGIEKGIRIKTSSYTRYHPNSVMCKAKATGNYMTSLMALREALDCGFDEALLLDSEGFISEGSGENFFMIKNGRIFTPELSSALGGITRDAVITLAADIGHPVREARLTRDQVYIADEAFFTGTAAEVTPIRELDGCAIGDGEPGPLTRQLQARFFDQVYGRRNEHAEWLSYIQ